MTEPEGVPPPPNLALMLGLVDGAPTYRTGRTGGQLAWRLEVPSTGGRKGWYSCVAWGPLADALRPELGEGVGCCIVGRLQIRRWTNARGAVQLTTEIVAERVFPLDEEGGLAPAHSAEALAMVATVLAHQLDVPAEPAAGADNF